MDEATAQELVEKLIAWGFIEVRDDGEVGPTRRWSAQLQAAAERINLQVEKSGAYPEGNPLVLAVAAAFLDARPTVDDAERDDLVRVLVTLELSRMSADKRARYGF